MLRYILVAILVPVSVSAQSVETYAVCLRAFTNLSTYISFAESERPVLPNRAIAAFNADLDAFIQMGIDRYGKRAVMRLVNEATEPDEAYIRAALALHRVDGPVKTFRILASMASPCGGPNGNLKSAIDAK